MALRRAVATLRFCSTEREAQASIGMNSDRDDRRLKVRVKTGKGRSLSSKLWLERQLNDPYVARAKREGFRSRAAFKLAEIDDKHHLLQARRARGRSWRRARRLEPGGGETHRRTRPCGRHRHSRHGTDRRRRLRTHRLSRSRRAGATEGHARRPGRRGALRHGRQRHRPPPHRSSEDHGAGRGGGASSPARCSSPAAAFSPR